MLLLVNKRNDTYIAGHESREIIQKAAKSATDANVGEWVGCKLELYIIDDLIQLIFRPVCLFRVLLKDRPSGLEINLFFIIIPLSHILI